MKRIAVLYVVIFAVILPLDFLFLGVLAKGFFRTQLTDPFLKQKGAALAAPFAVQYRLF